MLILALVIVLDIAGHKPSAQQKQYQAQCHDAKSRYWVILGHSDEALRTNENTEAGQREKKGREQVTYWCDLFAQQTAADAARYTATQSLWVTLLTGVGVILVAGTLVYTRKTLTSAKEATQAAEGATSAAWKAVDTAREIGAHEVRAYLSIENVRIQTPLLPTQTISGLKTIAFDYEIRNSGNSPAQNASVVPQVKFFYMNVTEAKSQDNKAGDAVEIGVITPGVLERTGQNIKDCFESTESNPITCSKILIELEITIVFHDVFGEAFFLKNLSGKSLKHWNHLWFRP